MDGAKFPAGKTVHAILDNYAAYAAHKHREVQKWLACHPRWTFHFTPTSVSWLNAVEGFLRHVKQAAAEARRLPIRR